MPVLNKTLPDKWVRKAVYDAINNIVVDGLVMPCYDQRVTRDDNSDIPMHYILLTTQSNIVNKSSKCDWDYESSILIDIITSYDLPGNPGSRLLADNILDAVIQATNALALDAGSGLTIYSQTPTFPNDITTITKKEAIFRKLFMLEFYVV